MMEKYSVDPSSRATDATTGAKKIMVRIAREPPMKDTIVVIRSATPARPFRVIG